MSGFWDVVGWGSGWFTRYINSNMIFRDNVKLYFGDGKDTSLYWDGSNFYIDLTSGSAYIQDQIYAATHLHLGDSDKIYLGTGDDAEIYFDATDLVIDATAGSIKFDSTDEYEFMFAGDVLLKFDEAAITEYTAAADTSATDVHLRAQSGGAHTSNDPNGANILFYCGQKGSGGAGSDGTFQVWHGAAASNDFISIYHDATNAFVNAGSGRIWFAIAGTNEFSILADTFAPNGSNTNDLGTTSSTMRAIYLGENASSGAFFGEDQDWRFWYDETTNDALTLAEGSVDALAIKGSAITAGNFIAAADTDGNDVYIHTQQGGAHTSNNPDGGDVYIVPGAKGATGSGAAGKLRVRDPASADTLDLWQDGSNSNIQSTNTILVRTAMTLLDDISYRFGSGSDWRFLNNTTNPANHLELQEGSVPALGFYGSTLQGQSFKAGDDTAGNALFIATQTGGDSTTGNGLAGATLTFEAGDGSDAFATEGGDGGDGGDIILVPGGEGAGDGAGSSGTQGQFKVQCDSSADVISFYHDDTNGWIGCDGTLILNTGTLITDNSAFSFGSDGDWKLKQATTNPANHFELQEGTVPALGFFGSTLQGQGFKGSDDTAGNALFIATQTGGDSTTGNGLAGATLTFEAGDGSDAFATEGGDGGAGGSFKFVCGAGGAEDGAGSAGADGTFQVWHGDEASGDYVEIYHDATHSYVNAGSGSLIFELAGTDEFLMNGTVFGPLAALANLRDLGRTNGEFRALYIGEDASSGVYFGLDQDARLYYDENSTDKLRLSGKQLTFEESVDSAAVADEVTVGRFDIGAGNTVLAISQETAVAADTDETKFSHKMQVRLNGASYYIMLTDS